MEPINSINTNGTVSPIGKVHMFNNNQETSPQSDSDPSKNSIDDINARDAPEDSSNSDNQSDIEGCNVIVNGEDKKPFNDKLISDCFLKIKELEDKCNAAKELQNALETKLDTVTKQRDVAIKEKENTVVRYAIGEKLVLEQKSAKELMEKKYKETLKENELLQHKLSSMFSEKSRIGQILDNKCYEYKTAQTEVKRLKADVSALETKVKWLQNNLKNEIEQRKENEAKVEVLTTKIQECMEETEQAKANAESSIKTFQTSQENRAHVLEQQMKEQQAMLILLKHEKDDREKQATTLQTDLERLQEKHQATLEENNCLSLKVQQLERERLDAEQKLSELRSYADQQRQDAANLALKTAQLEQLKLQIQNENEQFNACNEQMDIIKNRNSELEMDMESCREKEAELLLFTQQLTEKNVRLQSEFTTMETKVQQLTCEQALLKRTCKEYETKMEMLSLQLSEEKLRHESELREIHVKLEEKTKHCESAMQELADQKGENLVIKRKFEHSLKEVNKELQLCRKKLEQYDSLSTSNSSSTTSLNIDPNSTSKATEEAAKIAEPETTVDKKTLIEHIVKLQRASAKKSEKIDFLEEHVNTLIAELQRKSRLLQGYMMREQSGALSSNKMDNNKAHIAKSHGVMASVYGSRVADDTLTLELSLDINRKLQAVLEDALLKNITLKENVDTLGAEIERLNKILKSQQS